MKSKGKPTLYLLTIGGRHWHAWQILSSVYHSLPASAPPWTAPCLVPAGRNEMNQT